MKTVPPAALKRMLHDGAEIGLFDVREAGEFGESHLFHATPLPYSRLELDVGRLAPRRAARIVLCDDGAGDLAARAARRLAGLDYSDVAVLEGGTRAWGDAGFALFKGVNVPSKAFGELVEHACHTPRVTVQELARMRAQGENVIVVDGRPYAEYRKMNIPGGICCPNGELPLRIRTLAPDPTTRIVVNCAGRTRSILGAQTLINFGVPNPVYALENGTQGWVLAGFELERGSARRYPGETDTAALPALRQSAQRMMERFAVRPVSAAEATAWFDDSNRTTYLLDVRTPEEFEAGSLAGAVHAPGGQLIQATDQWVGIRNARVLLLDGGEMVRAPVVASWLRQLGCDAWVLEGGCRSGLSAPSPGSYAPPTPPPVSASELKGLLDAGRAHVVDLGSSISYRQSHIPGATWSIRPRLGRDVPLTAASAVVLVADDPAVAGLAAIDLREAGVSNVLRLEGGLDGWKRAGYATEATPGEPPDARCIDYLFFVHDRHAGNLEAMKQYLAWETGLIGQLDPQDLASFRINPA